MFYVFNVQRWLDEVTSACSENQLDPEDSVFVLLMFSSLDFDFVSFFRDRKKQISQYSGKSVHFFTPMIFDEDVVPDNEWRLVRDGFAAAGIRVGNRPSAILFRLRKRHDGTGYVPHYFAAFELPAFDRFQHRLRDIVDACIASRTDDTRLVRILATLLGAENLVANVRRDTPLSGWPISDVLHAPRVFLSYSHADAPAAMDVHTELKRRGVKLWLDRIDLSPGDVVLQQVERALRSCDAVLMLLSAHSANSRWVSFEGSFSHGHGKLVVPLVLDDEGKRLAHELPFLSGRMYLDLSDSTPRHEAFDRLVAALAELAVEGTG